MGKINIPIVLLSGVLITNEKGEYLLVQEARDKTYSKCKDKWVIPHGTYDAIGESILDLGKRELLEETGGKAEFDGRCICVEGYSIPLDKVFLTNMVWFASEFKIVQERRTDEIKDVKFFSKVDISELVRTGQIRDNFPILEVIEQFEKSQNGMVRWELSIG